MKRINEHLSMKQLPVSELPCEKFLSLGAKALSDAELISVILRNGTNKRRISEISRDIIDLCEENGGIGRLEGISLERLMRINGVGKIKAMQLKAVAEFSRRIKVRQSAQRLEYIRSAKDAADYLMSFLGFLDHEETWVLYLDGKSQLIKSACISRGTVNSSLVSAREIFKKALECNAVAFILSHNHPSGDPTPSECDLAVTDDIYKASLLMDITMLDHLVIGDHTYISIKEKTAFGKDNKWLQTHLV